MQKMKVFMMFGHHITAKKKTYFNITNNLNFMIMKVEKEMKYEAPEVVILEVDVEEGFAASPDPGNGPQTEPTPSPWD